MGYFLGHAKGAVKRVNGPWRRTPSLRVAVGGWPNKAQGGLFFTSICTQAGVIANGNFQFLHTINDTIFVYVFGDRISELAISGVAFGEPCDGLRPGIEEVFTLYTRDRIAVRAQPLIVLLGTRSFNAFLTGVSAEITDAETQLTQFSFRLHCFPAQT
jgi:hypothetical protein